MNSKADKIALRTSRFYDKIALPYSKTIGKDLSDRPWIRRFTQQLRNGAKVLDAGCGSGTFSAELLRAGCRVVGIDISERMVRLAGRRLPTAVFKRADIRTVHFKESSFDGVLLAYSLLHLPKRDALVVLKSFATFLKPRGTLCLMLKEGVGEEWLRASLSPTDNFYVRYWMVSDVLCACTEAGLRVLDVDIGVPGTRLEVQRRKIFVLARRLSQSGQL